jgi:L,D-peptidoglycan transpeptidase YkuD (ErfK/YbiS/YcfS/YnhG family)
MFKPNDQSVVTKYEVEINQKPYQCSVGRSGIVAAFDKKEGDGATPEGVFSLSPEVWYRSDKVDLEKIKHLNCRPITLNDGWCDDSKKPEYNQHVILPFDGSHEKLWRDDDAYDLIVVIPWNQQAATGKGSAIFLHVARESMPPTAGCVAFYKNDLLEILQYFSDDTQIIINKKEGISFSNLVNQIQNNLINVSSI